MFDQELLQELKKTSTYIHKFTSIDYRINANTPLSPLFCEAKHLISDNCQALTPQITFKSKLKTPSFHKSTATPTHQPRALTPEALLGLRTSLWAEQSGWAAKTPTNSTWMLETLNFQIHPQKLTWNLKIIPLKRKLIFNTVIFGFHVSFRGCIGTKLLK